MADVRVLLAEDDQSIATIISAALRAEDFAVDCCETVKERNEKLENADYDLLITDVLLDDADGIDGLEQVASALADVPVIIVSAQNTLDTAVRASKAKAFEYFPKPFDLDELVLAARQAVSSKKSGRIEKDLDYHDDEMPLVGRSPAMQNVYRTIAKLLNNDLSVLITGESGTGKELVAEAIHSLGHRKTGPFVPVNMAAIPGELIEAELFGYEKGAFTGAVSQSIGKFEQAQGGTLFLDEIGDMPVEAQTRLLRALQTGSITRVGGRANIKLDVRMIAATNKHFDSLIENGTFREDLYYRLNVMPIHIPPLRERVEDIPALTRHFLAEAVKEGLPAKELDQEAIDAISLQNWRGNVRELRNFIFRLAVICREDVIGVDAVLSLFGGADGAAVNSSQPGLEGAVIQIIAAARHDPSLEGKLYEHVLAAMEKPLLEEVMKRTAGNQLRAAAMLGINRNTLRKKLNDRSVSSERR